MSKIKSAKNHLLNRIYALLSRGDRSCSYCEHMKDEPDAHSEFMSLVTQGKIPIRMVTKCSFDDSIIKESEIGTRNCINFRRRFGSAPSIREIRSFLLVAKKEWKFLVGTILTVIAIFVAFSK